MKKHERKWIQPVFDFDEDTPPKKLTKSVSMKCQSTTPVEKRPVNTHTNVKPINIDYKNWMKQFDPKTVEELAIHNKKVREVEDWIKLMCNTSKNEMLLLTGPVGSGKTTTLYALAAKYNIRVMEWITPVDIEIPSENGQFEFRERQSTKFFQFILNAANFTSLIDNNTNKLVLVEDFPNTFLRTPSEFIDVLQQYKQRAKSPIVFICSECYTDNKNTASNLFTQAVKEQFNIHCITFNSVSVTSLRAALRRVANIISTTHTHTYNIPTQELIECVVNSSAGDVRSAVLNLHFACLKGSSQNLETSLVVEKKVKSKVNKKKKPSSSKFLSIGKDQTVSILHGVGRVLNPKLTENGRQEFTHSPSDIIEQFITQPSSFVNFLHENYLPHFSCIEHAERAAAAIGDADYMLAEWREKMCQEYGLYTSVAGLMLANKAPVSAWCPVLGPKNMRIKYPSPQEIPLLDPNYLYKGKTLVSDYETYCKIIGG